MNADMTTFLKTKAANIRNSVITVAVKNGAGHIAPSLSAIEILVALYHSAMTYRPSEPAWPGRDRLIFSKAHGAYGLYALLADIGVIPSYEWENFYCDGSTLTGCIERHLAYGLEAGCGSLGHGLPIAVGVAFGAILRGEPYHTFCVTGDGELQEGTTWEALQFAVKHRVDNLTIVVDKNRLQAMDFLHNIMDCGEDDLLARMRGFGLRPIACDGHDVAHLADLLGEARATRSGIPSAIVARTVKGRGLKCMENVPKFHFRIPTDEELSMGR